VLSTGKYQITGFADSLFKIQKPGCGFNPAFEKLVAMPLILQLTNYLNANVLFSLQEIRKVLYLGPAQRGT
jgi:hypothetical protein